MEQAEGGLEHLGAEAREVERRRDEERERERGEERLKVEGLEQELAALREELSALKPSEVRRRVAAYGTHAISNTLIALSIYKHFLLYLDCTTNYEA